MENFRLEGLERFVTTELVEWLNSEHGFIKADFEVIGAILFSKYKGEDKKLKELLESSLKIRQEAEELLERLRKKHEN